MARNPYRVFISRVSSEFGHVSSAVASDLRARGLEVKVQEDFTQGHTADTWLERLHEYIHDCDTVICICGLRSGGFPGREAIQPYLPLHPAELDRISFTQWEYFFAAHHRKNIFTYIAAASWTPDRPAATDDDSISQQDFFHYLRHHDNRISHDFDSALKLQNLVLREKWPDYSSAKPSNLPGGYIGRIFLGRDEFLETLRKSLRGWTHTTAITQKSAATGISGLGGIGKTHAAVEFAHRRRDDYTALLFASADTPEKLQSSLAALCGVLKLDENGSLPPDETTRVRAALGWLTTHPDWLLILDNVDDEPAALAVQKILSQLNDGHVLITSRLHGWSDQVKNIDLDVLSETSATELLLQLTAERRRLAPDDETQARQISILLEGLPLAIHQAAGFINEQTFTLAAYRARYNEEAADLLNWFNDLRIPYERPDKLAPRPVLVTWKTSFEQLSELDRSCLLVFCNYASEPIPEFLLLCAEDAAPEIKSLLREGRSAIAQAEKYCLLSRSPNEATFKIHRLVQQITLLQSTAENRQSSLEFGISLIFITAPGNPQDVRTWPKWDALLPHALALCARALDESAPQGLTQLLDSLGNLFHAKGRLIEAEELFRRAMEIDCAAYGDAHPNVAIRFNNLASVLLAMNRLVEAEPLMQAALRINRAAHGDDHPQVSRILNNLAQLFKVTNRLAEAEPLLREALRIDRAAYGADHPNVATLLNNLADLLKDTSRLAEAEPMMREALRIDLASFGDHPKIAIRLNNLALLLLDTNRPTEAASLMWEALRIDLTAYGNDHPKVAIRLSNLALLVATSCLADAEPLMREAVRILSGSYGPDHPQTVNAAQNLKLLHEEMAKMASKKTDTDDLKGE